MPVLLHPYGKPQRNVYEILYVFMNLLCKNWKRHADTTLPADVREPVHHDIIMKITNKMQLCRLIYYSLSALHVSGDVFAHHQEHFTVFTASGNITNIAAGWN